MKVSCPVCKKEIEFSEENPYRPFCSERCKTLDLGDWAMEKHAIPSDHSVESEEDSSKKPVKTPQNHEED